MQGPTLIIEKTCNDCEYLKVHIKSSRLEHRCEKTNNELLTSRPDKNCPFLEESLIQFHTESLFQLHENKEEKLKKKIENIFSDFKFEKLTINEIHLSIEEITEFHISEIQKELSQYNFKIERASDDVNLILTLTRKE